MASIRLEKVTKVFSTKPLLGRKRGSKAATQQTEIHESHSADSMQDVRALDDINFKVPDGQTTVVVGPSGCGKSTLLRVIAGLIDYDGDIYYDDRNMNEIPVKERHIGMVFQNYALYPHFYGHGNLSFFFKIKKAPDAETELRIKETSEIMGIGFSELLRRKPGTLSGGQQQRVAIGRAIVRKPELFLFDEPLSNLDAKLRTRTRIEIKRLLHRFNITAVYVTHDQTEALALADEIAVMRDGHIEQIGTYHNIINDPANQFVAGFLGLPPMNILRGIIGQSALHMDDIEITLPDSIKHLTVVGQHVNIGIRPENIVLQSKPSPTNSVQPIRVPAVVEVIEPDFGRQRNLIYLRFHEYTFTAMASLNADIHIGYPCDAYFKSSSIFYFDEVSGNRIG